MSIKKMGIIVLGFVLVSLTFIFCAYLFFLHIQFNRKCGGHLKRAADANTVETAKKELAMAINYMEKKELTSGYTSILYTTPDEDVGFWYENIKSAYQELDRVNPDATQLEKTNILMKLRETLMDGNNLTVPKAVQRHPHNRLFLVLFIVFFGLSIVGVFMVYKACYV